MKVPVGISDDGYMNLDLDESKKYVITKWYHNSLAIFEDKAFNSYLKKLETVFQDNGHGQSVMHYFVSAAVTMIERDDKGRGWLLPAELQRYVLRSGDRLIAVKDIGLGSYAEILPVMLLVSERYVDKAIAMTQEKHVLHTEAETDRRESSDGRSAVTGS